MSTPISDVVVDLQLRTQRIIQSILDDQTYTEEQIEPWCTQIVKAIVEDIAPTYKTHFKFVVKVTILSRASRQIVESQISLWEPGKDVRINTKWANETMQCAVSVWGFRYRKQMKMDEKTNEKPEM